MKRILTSITILASLTLLLAFAGTLHAQLANEGAILGVVADQTGAVIPGATVAVMNLDTGIAKQVTTDASGSFEILDLPIGSYNVTVSKGGFESWKLDKLVLEIGERSKLSPVLQPGTVSQQVNVSGLATQIQTETTDVATVIQEKQVTELPLNGRNTIQLVSLAPGMQFVGQESGAFGAERESNVMGSGVASQQTQFTMDGANVNSPMQEGAMAIPSVDTIAEFSVQTANFSAENGRFPMQVVLTTKGGTNHVHGSAWEFARNSAFSAENYFATSNPRLIQNQFGVAGGGPIIHDKSFFFGSWELLRIRQEQIFNNVVPTPTTLAGNFSSLATPIIDPQTGNPFPGNVIPSSRIDSAAKYFFPFLDSNASGAFHAIAPIIDDTSSGTARIDQVLTSKQHIYGRWVRYGSPETFYNITPDESETNNTIQNSYTLNYVYTITPKLIFSANVGYLRTNNTFIDPEVGHTSTTTAAAGIQGFSQASQQVDAGLPNVYISGYAGFGKPWGVNGKLYGHSWNGTTSVNYERGKHLIDVGLQYDNRAVYGSHGSFAVTGNFTFNGQYTGNALADYLLGLVQSAARNFPLAPFGQQKAPYTGIFVEDTYKVTPKVTLNLGLRYDHWYDKRLLYGQGATFDPKLGKVIAGVDSSGNVDLAAQGVGPYFGPATASEWVAANTVGIPAGLFQGNGYVSPRVGVSWNPIKSTVVRGAYGIFTSSFQGNTAASSIVGPPYWSYETPSFSAQSQQQWETAFPATPNTFGPASVAAPAWNITAQKMHEWNVAVEESLPLSSTLTMSYVGNHLFDGISGDSSYDAVPAGNYPNLQAALPYPLLSGVTLYENMGKSWYNALQAKWERRMVNGWTMTGSYAFSKLMSDNLATNAYANVQPLTPPGYLRGRSGTDVTHLLTANTVYEIPVGRGKKYWSGINRAADELIGGWELSGILSYASGAPLTFDVPGATLGNGYDTRPNLVGSLAVPHRSASLWFNPAALVAPAPYTYGQSGIGLIDAPATKGLDAALLKNFALREATYLQFRFEAFNAPNFVNFGAPNVSINEGSTGEIFTASAPRELQFGLKLIF